MNELIMEIKNKRLGNYLVNEPLSKYTTYKVGGVAKLMFFPNSISSLIELLKIIKRENIKYKVLGNGSNVIFSDKVYDGVIIKLDLINHLEIDGVYITVGAGYNLMKLAMKVSRRGLAGLEFATGIPGSVGGSIYMNAGAYKSDMGYIVESVKVITPSLEIKTLSNKEMNFHYRESFLSNNKDYICVEAKIKLNLGNTKDIMELIEDRKVRRLESQPLEYPSAGSVFRNPKDNFAGKLIEDVGLKGHKIGGAEVSMKHANFIINVGNSTANDVRNLIMHVKDKVKKRYDIDLLVEQEFVNWE